MPSANEHFKLLLQVEFGTAAVFSWFRSKMNQERFINLKVLNIHKERTDRLSTIDIANEFTDRNTNRKHNFGTFRVNDEQ